jgi:Common central domain of tyrosinase
MSDDPVELAKKFINYRDKIAEWRAEQRHTARDSPLRVRKNYRSLTDGERSRFVQALFDLKAKGIVDQFASVHERHFFHGIHRSSHFLPWHREFIRRFEDALRGFHPDITLPYWDSSVDQGRADPLWQNTFLGQFDGPWRLGRALGAESTLPTPQLVQDNQRRESYDPFWRELENPIHNQPHTWVGGVMASIASPGDPVFFLHHCWIDLLWARWQFAHPGVPFVSSGSEAGLNDPMSEWPDRTPAHVLDHHALGYKYDFEPSSVPGQRNVPAVGVASWGTDRLDVFAVDTNQQMRHKFWHINGQ